MNEHELCPYSCSRKKRLKQLLCWDCTVTACPNLLDSKCHQMVAIHAPSMSSTGNQERERERERGCVEENHKISNGGKTAKTVWDYILSHYDVPLKILPVRITRAGIKHLLHVWKKQCRNVTIWSSINDFICIEHLFPDESLSDSESGPRMWKHHCSLVVHAVHVCSVKARKGKKKKKHGTLCTWSGLRTPEE